MSNQSAREAAKAVWNASPAGTSAADGAQPGTREFFERAFAVRSHHEMPWLPRLVQFRSAMDQDVLEIGFGAGFDAYSFLSAGARYVGIDLAPANVDRARSHMALFGLHGTFLEAAAEALPFGDESFDVVFSNGVLHHLADPAIGFAEAARVLRRGGRGWIIVYNRDSIFYWFNVVLCRWLLGGGFRTESLRDRVAAIEHTTSRELPAVHLFSKRRLVRELTRAGLEVERVSIRKFTHEDVPEPGRMARLWYRVPQRWLDEVGRVFGWYLIARIRKP